MKRILISALAFTTLMLTSCDAKEQKQVSDTASAIQNEVVGEEVNDLFQPKDDKNPDLDQEFSYNTDEKKDYLVTIHTSVGDLKMVLFDETINHKKNFIKLASIGFYDSTAFHRIINNFMIQGGDPNTLTDNSNTYGTGGPGYTIPAEFNPKFMHQKGALAAARTGGPSNPNKESSGSQFYIVDGDLTPKPRLEQMANQKIQQFKMEATREILNKPENRGDLDQVMAFQKAGNAAGVDSIVKTYDLQVMEAIKNKAPNYTPEQYEIYATQGGTPFLDMDYTVYGQVVDGLELIDQLASVAVGGPSNSLPEEKQYITMEVELLKKKKITKMTGYKY